MKSNVSLVAALAAALLTAGCGHRGGGAPYSAGDYAPGYGAPQGYAAPAPGDGYGAPAPLLTPGPLPAPDAVSGGAGGYAGPGAGYAAPGAAGDSYPPAPVPAPDVAGGYGSADGPPPGGGPRATSGQGDTMYDAVGYVSVLSGGPAGQLAATAPGLPVGSFVEVTSLSTGHTVLLEVNITVPLASGRILGVSPAAAAALQLSGGSGEGVRVRQIVPSAQDQAMVRQGSAPQRLDAPDVLLVGLRRQLSGGAPGAGAPPPPAPLAGPPPKPKPGAGKPAPVAGKGGYLVQVAALSDRGRADALAKQVGGFVAAGGGLYRVQMGPYDRAGADRARAGVAARGFPDARVFEKR